MREFAEGEAVPAGREEQTELPQPRARSRVPPGGSRPPGTLLLHVPFSRDPRELLGLGENSVCVPDIRNGLKASAFRIRSL